jgi:hypothetical protein
MRGATGGTGPLAAWVRTVAVDRRPVLPWRNAEVRLIDDHHPPSRAEALAEEPP